MIANENVIDKSFPLEIIMPVSLVQKGWGLFCSGPLQGGGSSINSLGQ